MGTFKPNDLVLVVRNGHDNEVDSVDYITPTGQIRLLHNKQSLFTEKNRNDGTAKPVRNNVVCWYIEKWDGKEINK